MFQVIIAFRLTNFRLPEAPCPQHLPGNRIRVKKSLIIAFIHNLTAVRAGHRSHIHQMIGHRNDLPMVLHDQNGIAMVSQAVQRFLQTRDIL